jgi:hypothetical protein
MATDDGTEISFEEFTIDEALAGYAVATERPSQLDNPHLTDYLDAFLDARRTAGRRLRTRAELCDDEEFVYALADFALRAPLAARSPSFDALCATRKLTPEFFRKPACMTLSVKLYNDMSPNNNYRWTNYVNDELARDSSLTPAQRTLAATLITNWQGTGLSLVDTVLELCPA